MVKSLLTWHPFQTASSIDTSHKIAAEVTDVPARCTPTVCPIVNSDMPPFILCRLWYFMFWCPTPVCVCVAVCLFFLYIFKLGQGCVYVCVFCALLHSVHVWNLHLAGQSWQKTSPNQALLTLGDHFLAVTVLLMYLTLSYMEFPMMTNWGKALCLTWPMQSRWI